MVSGGVPASRPALENLRWTWIVIGVFGGAILISSFVVIVWQELPSPNVAILVGGMTVGLTGMLVGYKSPGETLVEPAVAGLILTVTSAGILRFAVGLPITVAEFGIAAVLGSFLALGGGWVGEVLQGTLVVADTDVPIQWPWILVGISIGLILNVYFVFMGRALFGLSSLGVLVSFSISFLITGFFVGYFSPGVTLIEPALAGGGLILMDALLARIGFHAPFPALAVLIGIGGAVFIALVGGWLGERIQRWKSSRSSIGPPGSQGSLPAELNTEGDSAWR